MECFFGQNFLQRAGHDISGIPVRSVTCLFEQGCGTTSYQHSFVYRPFQRISASVIQRVCGDRESCEKPLEYCQRFRNIIKSGITQILQNITEIDITIHQCQACSEVTQP